MPITLNGTTGIVGPDGSAATPSLAGADTNTGVFFPAADTVAIATGGTERVRTDSAGNVLVGVTSASYSAANRGVINVGGSSGGLAALISGTNKSYLFQSGVDLLVENDTTTGAIIFGTNASTERARFDSTGNFSITQAPGKYTVDTSGGATSIANGGTVNFPNASGMLVANNWANGNVTIYLCGGGVTTAVGSVGGQVGTLAYNGGIGGYTWTNNYGSTTTFGFFFVRTRITA